MVDSADEMYGGFDSFGALYRTHADAVLVYIARRVFDRELALDLTAETFARAFVSRKRFRGTTSAEAEAWIYTIARRQVANYIRRGKAERRAIEKLGIEVPRLDDEDLERVEILAGLHDLRGAVAAGLEALSAKQREALSLRVVEELSYPEVAERLGISEQTARARVSRGLRTLGAWLDAAPAPKEVC